MDDFNEKRGHRRPWWQFNVVPLMVVLFALVWVRHLTEMSQLPTILWTLAVLAGWVALGLFGLYIRVVGRANLWRRMRLVLYLAIPVVLVCWYAYRAHRQAEAVEYILGRRGLQPMVHFADGLSINMLRKDHDFHRYWGRVAGVRLQLADRGIFRQLARLDSMRSLSCTIEPRQIDSVARLDQLQELELTIHGLGHPDFSPLLDMNRLRSVHLNLYGNQESPSLESLAGLPIHGLHLQGLGALSESDILTILSLPLKSFTINTVQLTDVQKQQLRDKGLIK